MADEEYECGQCGLHEAEEVSGLWRCANCQYVEPECSCGELTGGHMPGCAFNTPRSLVYIVMCLPCTNKHKDLLTVLEQFVTPERCAVCSAIVSPSVNVLTPSQLVQEVMLACRDKRNQHEAI